jgi:hypothetical protein
MTTQLIAFALVPCFVHRVDAKATVFREGTLFPLTSVHNGTAIKRKKDYKSILSFDVYMHHPCCICPCSLFIHRVDDKAPVFREGTLFPLSSVHNGTAIEPKERCVPYFFRYVCKSTILKSEALSIIILSAVPTPANVNIAYVFSITLPMARTSW